MHTIHKLTDNQNDNPSRHRLREFDHGRGPDRRGGDRRRINSDDVHPEYADDLDS